MKSNKLLNFLLNILQIFMQMCVAVTTVNFLLHGFMKYESFRMFNTFYIGVVVIIYYLAKSFISNGKLAIIIHAAAALSVLFVVSGAAEDKSLVFVPAVLFGVYSVKKANQEPFILLDMGILFFCYIAGFSIKSQSATIMPFYCSVMYITAYFIWYNISNLNSFVLENRNVKSFNTEQAINVNSVMLTLFMLICAVVMYVITKLNLQTGIEVVLAGLWGLFVKLIRMLRLSNIIDVSEKVIVSENAGETNNMLRPIGIIHETHEGNMALNVIAGVFAAIIAVCMIILMIKAIMDLKYRKSQGNDVREFVRPDFGRKDKITGHKKSQKIFGKTNENVVRKLYKYTVNRKLKKGSHVEKSMTPTEISANVIGLNEACAELTALYEKARYSEENITGEEIQNVQKALKTMK